MQIEEFKIRVSPQGKMIFIYDDELIDLKDEGDIQITRVSHVEPTKDGQWEADLSPVGGPKLGPFSLHQEAIDAERSWLDNHAFGTLGE